MTPLQQAPFRFTLRHKLQGMADHWHHSPLEASLAETGWSLLLVFFNDSLGLTATSTTVAWMGVLLLACGSAEGEVIEQWSIT